MIEPFLDTGVEGPRSCLQASLLSGPLAPSEGEPFTENLRPWEWAKGWQMVVTDFFDYKQSSFSKTGQRPSPGKSLAKEGKGQGLCQTFDSDLWAAE